MNPARPRVLVGITGASGGCYGLELLAMLRAAGAETHLVVSPSGRRVLQMECDVRSLDGLADVLYPWRDIAAGPASGSMRLTGMVIVPCSARTASALAWGQTSDLITRAGDVMLKERRKIVIAIRETPLHAGHLEALHRLALLGAVIFPPVPAFYHRPGSLDEVVRQSCLRMLDQIGIELDSETRWPPGPDGKPA